ncbi:DELTA-sagatoxin-Srs1a-like [Cottoperca gobio]|uniref:DELTA-sagatoxin-Srs1a-like n=1 Tax=Cottoperca gobio TaxID=56716 RepID=A0A6J2RNG0_COTGO|nr:DELTA-sagatoxin-Srs1a-like [Cottoperca gobio]
MGDSAEALAAHLKSSRNIIIEITNLTSNYCLINPKVYLDCGNCHSPPQPTVRPLKTEVCSFTKSSGKATGVVGVLTYDLFERHRNTPHDKIALMFSVPYDNNSYQNWLAMAIYGHDKECDEKLYKEMYYDKEPQGFVRAEAKGCVLSYEGRQMDLKATMSPMGRSTVKLEVWDKLFIPTQQPL